MVMSLLYLVGLKTIKIKIDFYGQLTMKLFRLLLFNNLTDYAILKM
jgi:hypothetical protein